MDFFEMDFSSVPEVCMMGSIRQPVGWCNRGRTTGNHMLVLVTDGIGLFTINTQKFTLQAGDCLFLPKGVFYVASSENSCEYVFIHFNTSHAVTCVSQGDVEKFLNAIRKKQEDFCSAAPYELPASVLDRLFLKQHITLGARQDNIQHLICKCEQYRFDRSTCQKQCIDLTFSQILLDLQKISLSEQHTEKAIPVTLSKIILFIQQNYARALSLEEISITFGLSKQYIARLFRKYLDATVVQYIHALKLGHALELLKYSTMSVGEVADALGFSSSYYFCRLFKSFYHQPPSEYIKSELN